jgi:hypothetical protein
MKPKPSTVRSAQRLEMPATEGEYVENSVAFGKNHNRGIGKADCKLSIASDYRRRRNDIA